MQGLTTDILLSGNLFVQATISRPEGHQLRVLFERVSLNSMKFTCQIINYEVSMSKLLNRKTQFNQSKTKINQTFDMELSQNLLEMIRRNGCSVTSLSPDNTNVFRREQYITSPRTPGSYTPVRYINY